MSSLSAKARGEWAELVFLQEARRRGFEVAQPFGDTAAYDVLLDNGRRIFRVQVKSAHVAYKGGYQVNAARGAGHKRSYKANEIDYLVAYVAPLRQWYVIPAAKLAGHRALWLLPDGTRGQFERYRAAWRFFGVSLSG